MERAVHVGKYTLEKQAGRGATSVVYAGRSRRTGEEVAIKCIPSFPARNISLALNEITALQKISHPNVIRLVETVETNDRTYLVLEKCKFSLSSVAKAGPLPTKVVVRLARDLLVGLHHIHSLGIIHRDIKLGNVMISRANEVKIIDFGLSTDTSCRSPKTLCGTPEFISPEIINRRPYTKKTDIYSAGILVYFLAFRRDFAPSFLSALRAGAGDKDAQDLADLIAHMIEKDPDKRISAADALAHRVFRRFAPGVVGFENLADFSISTKLGKVDLRGHQLAFGGESSFVIKTGMNGVYQGDHLQYTPFALLDSKSLKMVSFCYSVVSLIKKKTPVVIIFTDRGKFFKMLEDGVYVYVDGQYTVEWKEGVFTAKRNKAHAPEYVVDEGEFKRWIYESIKYLNHSDARQLPVTVDRRTRPSPAPDAWPARDSVRQYDPPTASSTLHHLGQGASRQGESTEPPWGAHYTLPSGERELSCDNPLFVEGAAWVYRARPFVYKMLFADGTSATINARNSSLVYATPSASTEYEISNALPAHVQKKLRPFTYIDQQGAL